MKLIIDRFEGEYAVLEVKKGDLVKIPARLLENAAEGDVVEITVNRAEKDDRRKRIEKLENELFLD